MASRKDWTSFQPDRRRVDSHFVLLNPPPAIKSARKRRRRKPRHLARSRSGHRVLTAPQPVATSSRISAPKKSKPRPTSPGHLGTLTHEFVDLLTDTHTSADKIPRKRAVPSFLAVSHTLQSSTNQSEDAIINLQTAAVDPSPQQRRQLQIVKLLGYKQTKLLDSTWT